MCRLGAGELGNSDRAAAAAVIVLVAAATDADLTIDLFSDFAPGVIELWPLLVLLTSSSSP